MATPLDEVRHGNITVSYDLIDLPTGSVVQVSETGPQGARVIGRYATLDGAKAAYAAQNRAQVPLSPPPRR